MGTSVNVRELTETELERTIVRAFDYTQSRSFVLDANEALKELLRRIHEAKCMS